MKITKLIGSGAVSDAYLLDNGKVLLKGKRQDSFSNYQQLKEKFDLFNGKINSIKYPKIEKLYCPSEEYPYGAIIEDRIDGVELRNVLNVLNDKDKKKIGERIALFLNELHSIQINGDKSLEIEINVAKFDRSVKLLNEVLSLDLINQLELVKINYLNFLQGKEFCLTHGDLNLGNIFVQNNQIRGIIDFGNMEYYVPEVEFAHMYKSDKIIYNAMVQKYKGQIKEENVLLLELVMNVRHFKNILYDNDKKTKNLENIKSLLKEYIERINTNKIF